MFEAHQASMNAIPVNCLMRLSKHFIATRDAVLEKRGEATWTDGKMLVSIENTPRSYN